MFTIDLSTKRARTVLRFVTYLIMALAVGVITWICVLISWGYRFNEQTLSFQQGGLVQFDGFPQGATISIDGLKQSIQTPGKANLAVGDYKISMTKTGYRSWNKTISLSAGQLLWLNYARLVPQSVETTTVDTLPSIVATLPSPDHQWMFLQPSANQPDFVLADIRDEKNPKFTDFKLADNLLSKKDNAYGTIQLVEWDSSSQYVLLRHDAPDGRIEYIRLDRSKPENAVNVTQKFQLSMNEAHFAGNNANVIFATTDGVLRRFDIGASSVSAALAAGVRHFIVYGNDTLAYTADRQQIAGDASSMHQIMGVYQNNREMIVHQYPSSAQVLFDYSNYFGHDYLALTTTDSKTVDILRDPQKPNAGTAGSQLFATLETPVPPRWLSFSPNGRMILAQNNNSMSTYDLEEAKPYQKQLDFGTEITGPLRWLDDYYLYTDVGNTFHMFEFDGTNSNDITSVKAGYQPMLSDNNEQLFTIGQASFTDKPVMQRSQLIVK